MSYAGNPPAGPAFSERVTKKQVAAAALFRGDSTTLKIIDLSIYHDDDVWYDLPPFYPKIV